MTPDIYVCVTYQKIYVCVCVCVCVNNTMQVVLSPFIFLFFISHVKATKDARNNGTATDNIVITSFLLLPRKPLDILVYVAEPKQNKNQKKSGESTVQELR